MGILFLTKRQGRWQGPLNQIAPAHRPAA